MGDFQPFRGAGCSLAGVRMIICHLFLPNHESRSKMMDPDVAATEPCCCTCGDVEKSGRLFFPQFFFCFFFFIVHAVWDDEWPSHIGN